MQTKGHKNKMQRLKKQLLHLCRKEATRTPDPYVPNVVRYQLRYFPIASAKLHLYFGPANKREEKTWKTLLF